jgi:hypothetical protein
MSEKEYPHWNRIYWLVIIFTLLLITLLWVISNRFD